MVRIPTACLEPLVNKLVENISPIYWPSDVRDDLKHLAAAQQDSGVWRLAKNLVPNIDYIGQLGATWTKQDFERVCGVPCLLQRMEPSRTGKVMVLRPREARRAIRQHFQSPDAWYLHVAGAKVLVHTPLVDAMLRQYTYEVVSRATRDTSYLLSSLSSFPAKVANQLADVEADDPEEAAVWVLGQLKDIT